MAMERPIIASDLAQIGKVLRGVHFGSVHSTHPMAELFTPGSADGLLTALRNVVGNPGPANAMAKKARTEVLNSFTWQHHVNAILSRAKELDILE
jgi:hypothetical protein